MFPFETKNNKLIKPGKSNKIEISGIPDSLFDNELEIKTVEIFSAVTVEVFSHNFEDFIE